MCGISGIISQKNIDISTFVGMNQIIRHRGPDDEGFVFFDKDLKPTTAGSGDTAKEAWKSTHLYKPNLRVDKVKEEYKIALGHRRLSILDLSPSGHMPMCDKHEELWITYNGEVYNFIEIRTKLETLGYTFITTTDTEVILAAYEEWGVKCLDHFMGMFAIAILDKKNKTLFLARDRFGIKPLYYWISSDGDFYFASEIKQFTVSKEWKPKLNHQKAFDFIYASSTDHSSETMFKGVYHISGGHALLLDLKNSNFIEGKTVETIKWYDPSINKFHGSFEEAMGIFKEKFFQSIQMHLRADVKVGSTLSGGFDSSSITCVVNDILDKEGKVDIQNIFSAVDGDSIYSEKKWIEEVVRQTNVNAHYVTPNPKEALFEIDKIVWQMDEPTSSMSPYLGFLVDRMAKENGITVLLNGQGADEYLSGYGTYRKLQKQEALDSLKINKIKKEFGCSTSEALKMATRSSLRLIYASLFPEKYGKTFGNPLNSKKWFSYLDYSVLKADTSNIIKKGSPKISTYQNISKNQLTKFPLPMYLRWGDRNSMIHSVEARVPFLDHRLVEFCHSLPIEYLDIQGQTKRILLEAMKGIIPDKIYHRKDKMGYVAPDERWVKEEFTQTFRDLLKESIQYSQGIIKQEAMDYFEDIISGKEEFNYSYWRLIMFGHWMKKFNVKIG